MLQQMRFSSAYNCFKSGKSDENSLKIIRLSLRITLQKMNADSVLEIILSQKHSFVASSDSVLSI